VILNPRLIEENNCIGFRYDGKFAHGKNGFLIGKMRELPLAYYSGELFDNNVHVIIAKRNELLCAIWCYFEFGEISKDVRKIDQKLDVTASAVMKVPFDMEHWQRIAAERYPNGLPRPYSDDPTQWIFHGHPAQSDAPLQVAVARLLGYRWPAELDLQMELSDEARAWVKRCEDLLPFADEDGIV